MPQIYFETDDLKKLSDIELIQRQNKLQDMIAKCYSQPHSNNEIVQQMLTLEEAYTAEIDRRYDEGLIDDDELEELFEDADFV